MNRLITLLIILTTFHAARANVGVFAGSGQTIQLVHSADVQMVSEEVLVVLGRGRFLFDGTVPGMDRVEYQCKFTLKNRSAKAATIQVGFPLDSEFFGPGDMNKPGADAVLEYKFIARDEDKTYHVRFVPYDTTKRLAAIFLWDMEFRAGEARQLRIAYEMPMSMSLASAAKGQHKGKHAKKWYRNLENGLVEHCGYVTETAKSWAGPVEKAEIRVYLGGFEKYLSERRVVEQPELAVKGQHSSLGFPTGYCKDWLTHRQIEPKGWTEKDGMVTWHYKGRAPDEPLAVSYLLVAVPQSVDGLHSLVQSALIKKRDASEAEADKPLDSKKLEEAWTALSHEMDDLNDLREIIMASWGIVPEQERVAQVRG